MRIEVLYFEGCPNYRPAVERLRTVLRQEGLPAEIFEILRVLSRQDTVGEKDSFGIHQVRDIL